MGVATERAPRSTDSLRRRPTTPLVRWCRLVYWAVAWLLVAGLFAQIFLAGLGVFADGRTFATHRDFGYVLGLVPVGLLVLALVGRMPRIFVLGSIALGVQFGLQSVFVLLWPSAPVIAALHPVNGFLMLLLAVWLAISARRLAAFDGAA